MRSLMKTLVGKSFSSQRSRLKRPCDYMKLHSQLQAGSPERSGGEVATKKTSGEIVLVGSEFKRVQVFLRRTNPVWKSLVAAGAA